MTRYRPKQGLEAAIARMIAPKVQHITDQVADAAQRNAPPTKVWVSKGDAVVRPEHREAHGQEVPDNLRFVVKSPEYDQHHYGAGPHQQLRKPRDPEGTPGLTANCRCEAVKDPDGIARNIHAHPVKVSGSRVEGHVTCHGHRVVDSEFGTDKDDAARFMGRALAEIARRLRRR
ncbi:hypothetical protein ABZ671_18580 [Micromonospora sp. NPDC006766]|uniref:hypothetical protein n=1 Tax=Micromonospora sp. NPDC006766 TaxID=3154778 RepID=UPI0033CD6A16